MEEYKPKRFEIVNYSKSWQRSISISFAREQYGVTRDWYINMVLWKYAITIVVLRIKIKPTIYNK